MEAAMAAILDLFKRMPEVYMCMQWTLRRKECVLTEIVMQGVPQHVVPSELAGTPASVQRDAVNRLLKDKKIQLQMSADDSNTFVYKEIEAGKSAR